MDCEGEECKMNGTGTGLCPVTRGAEQFGDFVIVYFSYRI